MMNFARREPRWAVAFTVLLALILQVLPLPDWLDWLSAVRPSFIALVVIYWSIFAPHAGGIFAPWLAGLLLDVFKGDVLAQNALAMALIAYITMSLHQRLRNQTLVQQSLFVFAMLWVNEVVVWGIEGWTGQSVSSPWRWIQPLIGAALWPVIVLLLGRTHTRSIA
jgi:rod shape-determining protein MreD